MAKEFVKEGNRRLVGMGWGWLVGAWGLRCRTRETGYFGMLREPEAGSCLERRGRLEDRNGLG